MACPAASVTTQQSTVGNSDLLPDEWSRLEKRRTSVKEYETPKWRSNHVDVVSGRHTEQSMVDHASMLILRVPLYGRYSSCWIYGTTVI